MENNNDFEQLANALNNDINKQFKDKKAMKTLLITSSKSYVSKTHSYEVLNLVVSFAASLYFITRGIHYSEHTLLLISGIIASALWVAQFIYSIVGLKKLATINTSEDPVITSIEKIISMTKFYTLQKYIYMWLGAPLSMISMFPIPLYEFRKIDLMNFSTTYIICLISFTTLGTMILCKYFWEKKFNEPLEYAKQNLSELLD